MFLMGTTATFFVKMSLATSAYLYQSARPLAAPKSVRSIWNCCLASDKGTKLLFCLAFLFCVPSCLARKACTSALVMLLSRVFACWNVSARLPKPCSRS